MTLSSPCLPLGLPLVRTAVSEEYFDWPALPELVPGVVSRCEDQPGWVPR